MKTLTLLFLLCALPSLADEPKVVRQIGPGTYLQTGGATVISGELATEPVKRFFVPDQSRMYRFGTGDKPTPRQIERREIRKLISEYLF